MRIVKDDITPEERKAAIQRRLWGIIFTIFVIAAMLTLLMTAIRSAQLGPTVEDPYEDYRPLEQDSSPSGDQ